MAKPWLTSADLIAAVKRKISFPIAQQTFSEEDVLAFANEEMMMQQVPSILMYHEEYFVISVDVPIVSEQDHYPIPKRAIGLKLRDIYFKDTSGNLIEMTRIAPEDRAYWGPRSTTGTINTIQKYYLEGNDIVLIPGPGPNATGSLTMMYFLRPNQLVPNDQVATITSFSKTITITNGSLSPGDTVTINDVTLTAVSSSPSTNEFEIGGSSTATGTNLSTAIGLYVSGLISASNGSPATDVVTLSSNDVSLEVTSSNSLALTISNGIMINCDSIPESLVAGVKIDFLQTEPGHKTLRMDVDMPSTISGTSISFDTADIPTDIVIGDYIALAGECIIPQIPTDLHSSLADRTAIRMLESIGDQAGVGALAARLQNVERSTGTLIDTRVEGHLSKVNPRHSILRYSRSSLRRRR